jgi:RNA polymerase sigma-70 factor (ECF subfamily)
MNTTTDLQLIDRLRSGDDEAAEILVTAHAGEAFRLALSILDDPAEAEEAAQDALLTALRSLGSFRGDSAFSTWLYAVTLNTCRMRLRRRTRWLRLRRTLQSIFSQESSPPPLPEDSAIRHESQALVWRALQQLAENERLVITLRYYTGLSIAQIAALQNVSERTVYKRLEKAHARLRSLLEVHSGE